MLSMIRLEIKKLRIWKAGLPGKSLEGGTGGRICKRAVLQRIRGEAIKSPLRMIKRLLEALNKEYAVISMDVTRMLHYAWSGSEGGELCGRK